jgi:hypothetical protein
LASAKRSVKLNNGVLELNSDGATYTTVRLRLPQAPPQS